MAFDSKYALNDAIRYLTKVAERRAAGGWVPPKERERQQKEAMRAEEKQARQAEKQQQAQQKQFIADEKERQKNLAAFQKGNHPEVPHVVYHGSGNDLSSFDPNKAMSEGGAFYFSKDSHTKHGEGARNAGTYAPSRGGSIYPVHLSMKNPHIVGFTKPLPEDQEGVDKWVEEQEKFDRQFDDERFKTRYFRDAIRHARQNGHDGVIIKNITDDRHHNPIFSFPSDIFIAFEPTQIKSATGNNGNFDPTSPRINEARGGPILSKQFPTQYMPNVGRQVMADGGKTTEERQQDATDMNFHPTVLYHAGHSDFPQFELQNWAKATGEKAHFFTTDPKVADSYLGGQYIRADAPDAIKHGVAPMGNNVGRIYAQGAQVYPVRIRDVNEDTFHVYDMGGGSYNPSFMKQALNEAKRDKKKGIVLMGVKDPGMFQSGPLGSAMGKSNLVAVFDKYANHIRSVNAQFNPKDKNNRDLLKSEGGEIGRQVMNTGGTPDDDNLMVVHNTSTRKLTHADKLGGLAVPSLAIIKPSEGFHNFGNISLIGHPDMAKPSRDNPVFASDVYSPRFPNIDEETGKIFKGFTASGYRRYAPATLENIVKEMKGKVRGGENWNYGAGSVRSAVTPKFKDQKQIKKSADRIVSEEQFKPLGEETNDKLWELAGKFHPYSKYSGNRHQHADDFANMLAESVTRGHRSITEHHTEDLPSEHLDEAREFVNYLRDMPTAYFEAKPQRAVGIHEFQGAVVPEDELENVKPILDKHGISRVVTYGGETDQERKANRNAALSSFSDLKFARGGYVSRQGLNTGGTPDQPQRQLSPMGFYSAAAERASALQPSGNAVQMINSLRNLHGVKTEELQNAGLIDQSNNVHPDWAGRGKVTRDELMSHLQGQMPQVEETVLGGRRSNYQPKYEQYTLPGGENYREVLLKLPHEKKQRVGVTSTGHIFTEDELSDPIVRRTAEKIGLTMEDRMMPTMQPFYSPHWKDDPNVLAHIRMSDRIGPNGEKILHIEELQSDWGQKGKKKGFWSEEKQADKIAAREELQQMNKELRDRYKDMLINKMGQTEQVAQARAAQNTPQVIAEMLGVQEIYNNVLDRATVSPHENPPSAPYVTSTEGWTDLALKRVLKEAAEGGYDKIVWTPGAEQAKRYDLSKQVSRVYLSDPVWHGDNDIRGTLIATDHNGNDIIAKPVKSRSEIVELIGKEAGEKLIDDPSHMEGRSHVLQGDGLRVGGEGMKGYYDSIVPKRLQNLAKKHDKNARIGYHNISDKYHVVAPSGQNITAEPVDSEEHANDIIRTLGRDNPLDLSVKKVPIQMPGLDITPAMRKSILRGQSAYKRGGTVSKKHPALSIAGTHIREETHGEPIFTGRL